MVTETNHQCLDFTTSLAKIAIVTALGSLGVGYPKPRDVNNRRWPTISISCSECMTVVANMLTNSILLLLAFMLCKPCFTQNSPLVGKSFSIKTKISIRSSPTQLLLEENYSKPQNRAKIRVRHSHERTTNPDLEEFNYSGYGDNGLLYSPTKNSCEQVDLSQFYIKSLHFEFDFNRLMKLAVPNSNPVIGSARLLMLVAGRVDLLKDPTEQTFLGVPVVGYSFRIRLPGGDQTPMELQIYYEKSSHHPAELEDQFPIFIVWESLWLHYYQLEINHNDRTLTGYQPTTSVEEPGQSEDIQLDKFVTPSTSKCLQLLGLYNIYSMIYFQSSKFSFEAETLDSSGFQQHHWVQFDGLLQALRIDSHEHSAPNELKSSIINLRTNRRYLITGGRDEKEPKNCLVMKNLGKMRGNFRLSSLLIGEARLSLIGAARVRGIDASVYATLSDNLPYWFEQPVLYQRSGTDEALRRLGLTPDKEASHDKSAATDSHRYKLLVYLDESNENRLLALDVYDLHGDESERLLSVRFRDFVWRLTEAPDGSQPNQLFALADACSARPKEDFYLEVDMVLRQENSSSIRGTWIQDWPKLESALLVGLVDSLDLDGTMIHDLESRTRRDQSLVLGVHFRLAEQSQLLHSLKLIGMANLRPVGNSVRGLALRHKGSALLLTDCLSLAASSKQIKVSPTYVYYSEQHFACLIDPTLDGADEGDLGKSPIIELISRPGKAATGELYQIETHLDHSFSGGILQDKQLAGLNDRVLILNHATGRPAQPIDPAIFRMRIEHVQINNNNFHSFDLDGLDRRAARSPSVAFLVDASTEYNRLIESPSDNQGPLKFKHCQAACLADFECAAFSYCVRFPSSECILSEISISELGKNFTKIVQESTQTISILTDAHGEVKLRKDARCELHQKSYLSQFIRGEKEKNFLAGHWIIPVANAEECAESCFMKTIQIIKSMSHETGLAKEDTRQVCTRFLYLNSLLSDAQADALQAAIGAPDFDVRAHSGGFCRIQRDPDTRDDSSLSVFFNFDYFDFDFTTLYEKTHGMSLVDMSSITEKAALLRVHFRNPEQEDYDVMERADLEGRNIQLEDPDLSEQLCARKCLMQTTFLLPACRSFDVVRIEHPGSMAAHISCLFNTRLANQTEHQYLRNSSSSSFYIEDRWHYEPSWDFLRRAIEVDAHNAPARRRSGHSNSECQQGSFISGASIVICLIVLAKMSGFILGIGLTKKFLIWKKSGSKRSGRLNRDSEGDIALE